MAFELDELLSYDTYRVVRIKDYRLGLPYYLLLFATFMYIVFGQLIAGSMYLAMETAISGSVRLSMRAPAWNSPIWKSNVAQLPYCQNTCNGDCTGNINQKLLSCPSTYANAESAVYPAPDSNGIFITTRVDEEVQKLPPQCANVDQASQAYGNQCRKWVVTKNSSYYIAQVEDYLVKVDHSMLAPDKRGTRVGFDMADGCLLKNSVERLQNSKSMCLEGSIDPCADYTKNGWTCPTAAGPWSVAVGANKRDDVMMLRTLLAAAGISSLDAIHGARPTATNDMTYRRGGMVLLLQIHYDNTWASKYVFGTDTTKYRYEYSIAYVSNQGYEVTQVLQSASPDQRTVLRRHGIRIVVSQTGHVGEFSFQALLVTCTASLGLMAVATSVVEILLRFVLPEKDKYCKHKFLETETLTDRLLTKPSMKVSLGRLSPLAARRKVSTGPAEDGDGSIYNSEETGAGL